MRKNIIVVTGGAGFIGSHMIEILLKKTKFKIISLDNYSTGKKKNHILNNRVKYIRGNSKDIFKILKLFIKKIYTVFHFGEFSRIHQSFKNLRECNESNIIGSSMVFDFCLSNKIKLVYSATSASLGNNGNDKNLSPYAFTKTKNLELLDNLNRWFNFKFEIIYFYNVYGPRQIDTGKMATVIGIFENQYKKKIPLTVVKPGYQSRRFTHIKDTVLACYLAWKKNRCSQYIISSKESYTILQVAKMFGSKIKFLPQRSGERYFSALTNVNLSNKVYKIFGKIKLSDYIKNIVR